ncbi:MAG: UDP binding domain-containing protein, partial [Hyphomicrobiaceae bacterium]
SIEAAEMVKYADNVWHATKVAFGNEIGRLCKALDIDSHEVMNVFVKDTKLNLSPYYLKPGFAFGGSCLPKEVRAVAHLATDLGIELPLIQNLTSSNDRHIDQAVRLLESFAGKRIGFLGLTFKTDTDDLRESPTLELMARLQAKGETLLAYDPNIAFGPHLQSQIDYVRHACPSQARLMDNLKSLTVSTAGEVLENCDVVVVSHSTEQFRNAVKSRNSNVHVLDLARLFPVLPQDDATYQGIAW